MARKETLDRALMTRTLTELQTTDLDSLLSSPTEDLLAYIRTVPLLYGFWGDFKRLFKAAEKSAAPKPISALLARLDTADLPRHTPYLPEAPQSESLQGMGRLDFDGRVAYLLGGRWSEQGVSIVDVTLSAIPKLISAIRLPGVIDVVVNGTKLWLLQGNTWNSPGRLSCYDVTSPEHPRPESGVEIKDGVRIAVSGGLVGVLTTDSRKSGLQLIDASQPGQLRHLGHLNVASPVAIQIVGSLVYIVSASDRRRTPHSLIIADISDPLQPRRIHEIAVPPTTDLAVQGRYAYLACMQGDYYPADAETGLAVIDLAPPDFASARRVALLPLGKVQNLFVQGRYGYVSVAAADYSARNSGGLRILDLADPANPQVIGTFLTDAAGCLKVVGSTVCINVYAHLSYHLRTLEVSELARPLLLGTSPSRETLGYMKRRGRRMLRALALQDPAKYVQTAMQMLLQAGQAEPELDPCKQWITMDLLYGGGARYEQQAHGRGSYRALRRGFSLRTREERFPELWDRYPELAAQLFTTPKLPWETWEAACKMLRSGETPLPTLNERMLAGFLASESPLLRAVAGRQVTATLQTGRNVAADIVAETFFGGTRQQRGVIGSYLAQRSSDVRWNTAFASRLYKLAASAIQGAQLPRKATLSFALLVSQYPTLFQQALQPTTVVALYNTHRADFTAWALEAFQNILPMQLAEWLNALENLPVETRAAAMEAVQAGLATKEIPSKNAGELVRHPSAWIRQAAWQILAHSQTPLTTLATLWGELLDSVEATPALLTAFDSPDARLLFARCAFDSRRMAELLEAHPFLTPLLPTAVLEKVVAILPPTAVLNLASEATEAQWPGLRLALLMGPLLPEYRAAFWREAFAVIGATGNANLVSRLLDDTQMQSAFLQMSDVSEFLRSANPVFGPILGHWIGAHSDLLRRDSADLLQISTHPLPEIRSVGLNRVREVGMSMPFALRLLESELPPSVALGKTFFEAMEAVDSQRTEAITALCDSPKPSVRAYGRSVLTARPEMLTDTDMLERLSENPDPETQAFVAQQLAIQPPPTGPTLAFDRAVLRARDKGRRAKEFVKARLDTQPSPDIPLLLEMARSRTPRDADWALGQLARLALEGVDIPGFTLEGVAGG